MAPSVEKATHLACRVALAVIGAACGSVAGGGLGEGPGEGPSVGIVGSGGPGHDYGSDAGATESGAGQHGGTGADAGHSGGGQPDSGYGSGSDSGGSGADDGGSSEDASTGGPVDAGSGGSVTFELPAGLFPSLDWVISGPAGYYSGTAKLGDAHSIEFVVGGIDAGSGYTMTLAGVDRYGDSCSGTSSPFAVAAGELSGTAVVLDCVRPGDAAPAPVVTGSVGVDAGVIFGDQ